MIGQTSENEVANFVWPSKEDLRKMPSDQSFSLSLFSWMEQKQTEYAWISNVSIQLANGHFSEMVGHQDLSLDIKSIVFEKERPVKFIRQWNVNKRLQHLEFLDAERRPLCGVHADKRMPSRYCEIALKQEEEIVGIYGHLSQKRGLCCFGFIVWKPPR